MVNEGLICDEIVVNFKLLDSLVKIWVNCGYYGFISYDVKVMYVLYFGWFDGNLVIFDELLFEEVVKKFVEYMGGVDVIFQKVKVDFDQGNYCWVVQVVSKVVFVDLNNQNVCNFEVDVLE